MSRIVESFQMQRALASQMAAPLQALSGRLGGRRFPEGHAIHAALEGVDMAIVASLADASATLVGRSSFRTEAPA